MSSLKPARRPTRTHPKAQIAQVAESIRRFRVMVPVVAERRHRRIGAGHARLEAAKLVGLENIPVIWADHLSEAELRAFSLADNKLSEKGGWDREALAVELQELEVMLPEVGLDLSITGFEPGEIDALLEDFGEERPNPADDFTDAIGGPAVCRTGDLFLLRKHRLLVGDARDEDTFARLMAGELAEMAFLDPPYNVRVAGHVGGRGRIRHREFACASGEMSPEAFGAFLRCTLGLCARFSADGAIHYVCMDWRHARELLEAGAAAYDELKNLCVWAKTNAGQSQTRICTDGTLSGSASYQYSACACDPSSSYSCSGQNIVRTSIDASCATTVTNPHTTCAAPSFCFAGSSSCLYPPPLFIQSGDKTGHLQLKPQLVRKGGARKVFWNVDNVTDCAVTSHDDSWIGSTSGPSGQTSSPISQKTVFTLSCTGLDGSNIRETATGGVVPVFREI